jgi:hypothetical protein
MRTVMRLGLIVLVGAACARAPAVEIPAAPRPAPAVLQPPATDLTGTWATGTGAEPAASRIELRPGCTVNPAVWIIEQTGNELQSWAFPESYNQGIVPKGPGRARAASVPGWISATEVSIDDGQDRYVLRYDVESQHLRGTRNGAPFWAVRQVVVRTEACPGVPSR